MEYENDLVKQYVNNVQVQKRFIINKFLEEDENLILLKSYLNYPDFEKQKLLDTAFKSFLLKFRKKCYFSKLVRLKSIDFSKRYYKLNKRYPLTLDAPLKFVDTSLTSKELLISEDVVSFQVGDPMENIENDGLQKALKILTSKQRLVIRLMYFHNLSQTEIALKIGSTPQNINKIHKNALNQIKKYYISSLS
ncbi:sigma-70 family RNA polymerase sigma factor [Bacillus sp. OAE603]|uniref:sigma-70 family RNA polymerase sigma factor n=1 Tax=Gottfriedia sp. OAE603 TaxID=2663872 RepID=UPI00178A3DE9